MFVSSAEGLKEENQEVVGIAPAAVPFRGVNSKSDAFVFCAGAGEGLVLDRDDELVLTSDLGKPKNDLDVLASTLTPDASMDLTAEAEPVLSFFVVSSALMEGDLSSNIGASCVLESEEDFGFLCLAVSFSERCEWGRASDFPKEKRLSGSIMRSYLCLRDASFVDA